jgi:carbonic anhydrase
MNKPIAFVVAAAVATLCVLCGCRSSEPAGATAGDPSAGAQADDQKRWTATTRPTARTREDQAAMTPGRALATLRAGNVRFVKDRARSRNLPEQVVATSSAQYPFAVVLSCLDSRQPVEMIFDQGIGDLFIARVAGNVQNDDILGSLEFACNVSGAKLIVVLGHSNCGAVKGAIDNVELGHLTGLLDRIKPAIAAVPQGAGARDSKNSAFVEEVAEANVRQVMQQIRERSPILREMIDQQKIALVGGMYDLTTGKVDFYPE